MRNGFCFGSVLLMIIGAGVLMIGLSVVSMGCEGPRIKMQLDDLVPKIDQTYIEVTSGDLSEEAKSTLQPALLNLRDSLAVLDKKAAGENSKVLKPRIQEVDEMIAIVGGKGRHFSTNRLINEFEKLK